MKNIDSKDFVSRWRKPGEVFIPGYHTLRNPLYRKRHLTQRFIQERSNAIENQFRYDPSLPPLMLAATAKFEPNSYVSEAFPGTVRYKDGLPMANRRHAVQAVTNPELYRGDILAQRMLHPENYGHPIRQIVRKYRASLRRKAAVRRNIINPAMARAISRR